MAVSQGERLVFNYGHRLGRTVAGRPALETPSARYTEAVTWRTWRDVDRGYLGLLAFTIVLLTRPQSAVLLRCVDEVTAQFIEALLREASIETAASPAPQLDAGALLRHLLEDGTFREIRR